MNEHGPDGNSDVVYQPGIFRLLSTRPASIFSRPTEWQNSSVAFGPMWGERYGVDRILVGNVVLQFSRRLSNAHFIGTGEGYSYWENVRISGIRPGNGGSVQHWHWNWHADNWVP